MIFICLCNYTRYHNGFLFNGFDGILVIYWYHFKLVHEIWLPVLWIWFLIGYSFIKCNNDFVFICWSWSSFIWWTIYPPLSAQARSGMGMTLVISMAIFIASSLMGSLNYIVTVINLRTECQWLDCLYNWAFFVTAIISCFFPVYCLLLYCWFLTEVWTSFFLFWYLYCGEVTLSRWFSSFLSICLVLRHPEVYIVLLPALLHQRLLQLIHKPIFLVTEPWLCQLLAIAFLSTIVWGHHMFISEWIHFRFCVSLQHY
jgi:heme/copper-type cytochrome/quinol oxidase subunit 1